MTRFRGWLLALLAAIGVVALAPTSTAFAATNPFIVGLHAISTIASTVPGNGDVNPYGVAVVPRSTGALVRGDILVSNFNDSANAQGTGTTIMQISPGGQMSVFASINAGASPAGACPGGVGLTTALVALQSGWVIVGSLPTSDGTAATAQAGCLIVVNSHGQVVETFSGGAINGPWDMTALDNGATAQLFVTNVLNGTVAASPNVVNGGTVVRIGLDSLNGAAPHMTSQTTIGSGFAERTDPAALVIGPTGDALAANGTLYVADSLGNRIAAISNAATRGSSAGTGVTVSASGALNDPLGLTLAPNGDILTVNGNNGKIIETTPGGALAATRYLDRSGLPRGSGALFGLAVALDGSALYFVDDAVNTLNTLH